MKFIAIFVLLHSSAFAVKIGNWEFTEEEVAKMHQGLDHWRSFAATASSLPPDKAIPELIIGLRRTTDTSIYLVGDREGVRKQIQDAFMAIPGYAEYIEKEINDAYLKWGVFPEEGRPRHRAAYGVKRQEMFSTLENLPGPQTVRVLGNFLSDHRGGFNPEKETVEQYIESGIPENFQAACNTLREMIDYPPFQHLVSGATGTLEAWTTWYTQVKEGRRTFRFKGNPQEYDLNGPVSEAKNPDIPRPNRRPDTNLSDPVGSAPQSAAAANTSAAKSPSIASSRAPWIIGGIITLIAAAFYLVRRAKSED